MDKSKDENQKLLSPEGEDNRFDTQVVGTNEFTAPITGIKLFTIIILFFINLLNYIDRFTVAGNLATIQQDFGNIDDSRAGLLQTVFVVSYMLCAPLFGYLGDRFNRTYLMSGGIAIWSITALASSFVPGDMFWLFLILRGVVGIGEASYSTISPTIIADLFINDQRSLMLALFYFAIPVGSGLGYVIGGAIGHQFGWRWALRFSAPLGIVSILIIQVLIKEPERGQIETSHKHVATNYRKDILYLMQHKTFIWSTLGYVTVTWVTGALAWWGPKTMEAAYDEQNLKKNSVTIIFGVITCLSGFLGVGIGAEIARRLKHITPRADPLVCACGLISSAPFLYVALTFADQFHSIPTWIFIFIGETCISLNWSVAMDMLLHVIIPTRRATANAVQLLCSHLFGDATSPYIIGLISDAIKNGDNSKQFIPLQYALYTTVFIAVIGGFFYFMTSFFIESDRKKTVNAMNDTDDSSTSCIEDEQIVHSNNIMDNITDESYSHLVSI